ncbi:MAG: hypothetical protein HC831_00420 [Chloroflexia bacterium]|nr:hypothetical protein [Chloroflexia bacterium]
MKFRQKKSSNVLSIEVAQNNIYLGLDRLILCYNKNLTEIKQKFSFPKEGTPFKLSYHNELSGLISGTYNMCNLIKDGQENRIYHLPKQVKKIMPGNTAIMSLAAGNGKYFWIGTYSGLYKISDDEIVYNSEKDDTWQQSTYAIWENNDNSLWLGTLNGLLEYKNEIWLGTNKGVDRLVFVNNNLELISRIDYGQGLKGDEINQILIDKNMLISPQEMGLIILILTN